MRHHRNGGGISGRRQKPGYVTNPMRSIQPREVYCNPTSHKRRGPHTPGNATRGGRTFRLPRYSRTTAHRNVRSAAMPRTRFSDLRACCTLSLASISSAPVVLSPSCRRPLSAAAVARYACQSCQSPPCRLSHRADQAVGVCVCVCSADNPPAIVPAVLTRAAAIGAVPSDSFMW